MMYKESGTPRRKSTIINSHSCAGKGKLISNDKQYVEMESVVSKQVKKKILTGINCY